VIFKEKSDLPLISGTLYLPTGSSSGNCGVPGLSAIAIDQMREGGTKSYSPDDLDVFLDQNAAVIESQQSEDFSQVSFSSLSEDFEPVFSAFEEVVLSPRFDKSRLSLTKRLMLEDVIRRKDDPGKMAGMSFSYVTYGEGSKWYDPVTLNSIEKLNISNLRKYYDTVVTPKGAYLVVMGDIDAEKFFAKIDGKLSAWGSGSSKVKNSLCNLEAQNADANIKLLETLKSSKPTIYVLNRDFVQSSVVMGHAIPTISEIDVYKMAVFNRTFGSGSFDSLLFKEIRDKRGLAYGISGGMNPSHYRGFFTVNLATRSSAVSDAVQAISEVMSDVLTEGFDQASVLGAIKSSVQAFVFKFEDPFFAISRTPLIKLSGFPDDYDDEYLDQIQNLKESDFKEFANKFIHENHIKVVIVGSVTPEQIKESLKDSDFQICELEFDQVPSLKKCYK